LASKVLIDAIEEVQSGGTTLSVFPLGGNEHLEETS
jgi:hypothetical protein